MSKGLSLLVVMIAAWAPVRASAARRSARRTTALAILQRARKDMASGDCRKAIAKLQRGYKLHHHYVFPMLEGICLLRLDKPLQAKALLLEAREVAGRRLPAHHKKLIADKLEAVATRLKYDKIALLTEPRVGVLVEVDGTQIGTSPLSDPLVLNRGVHRLKASAPGHRDKVITLAAKGGANRIVTIRLEKTKAPHPRDSGQVTQKTRPDPRTTPSKTHPRRSSRSALLTKTLLWGGIAGLTVGAALLVPGVVFLAVTGRDAGFEHNAPYQRIRYDMKTPGISLTALGATLLTAGAAALAASFILPTRKDEKQAPLARPVIGFSGRGFTMGLSGRF